ncbi:MAG: hypothetical protein ACO1SX_13100 [Actinomycetota bacterium]
MTVHTICDNCGLEYVGPGVTLGGNIYCCAGCARCGPCTCGGADTVVVGGGDAVVYGGDAVVVTDGDTVIAPGGSTTIIR